MKLNSIILFNLGRGCVRVQQPGDEAGEDLRSPDWFGVRNPRRPQARVGRCLSAHPQTNPSDRQTS